MGYNDQNEKINTKLSYINGTPEAKTKIQFVIMCNNKILKWCKKTDNKGVAAACELRYTNKTNIKIWIIYF